MRRQGWGWVLLVRGRADEGKGGKKISYFTVSGYKIGMNA